MTPRLSPDAWEAFLDLHPEAHLLQTAAWGELKSGFGWTPVRVAAGAAGAQILLRRFPLGFCLAYIPRGPVGKWLPDLIPHLLQVCREAGAFALKIEPDALDEPWLEAELQRAGFVPSRHTIQPRRTLVVDLRESDDVLLSKMHPKTRYNIHLAERRGVTVRAWNDVEGFHRMLQTTSARDEFGVHRADYYAHAYSLFQARGECELLLAEKDGLALAGLMVFGRGSRAWYLYGASTNESRNLMPTYLLQWEAMRWARRRGCESYDLWGIPDEDEAALEAEFTRRSDGLWGVYRFKRGFGGKNERTAGAWDLVLQPLVYRAYLLVAAGRLQG
ncbi:MAG TPA: peptidoglycan bridge formation glycyltransferase FemA/FemB family protein [Anaerolineales bacterium]|nr:peptidoglycan bridge formation glycyltransferase FemA/FemB family protein [Anaerolineales bacterium]